MEQAGYSIGKVAELSGVSIRALRHYESMGLLRPKRKDNGYRCYETEDIERLQQILLFRACGVELARIGQLLDQPDFDTRTALHAHLDALHMRKQQLESLIATVETTLQSLEKGTPMTNQERFAGIKQAAVAANESTYGAEARMRWGDAAVDAANNALLSMDEETWNDMHALEAKIIDALSAAMASGNPQGAEAQQLARMHARWIELHWGAGAYTPEAHKQLAQGYLADNRFIRYYDDRAGEGATTFLAQAIQACI